MAALRIAPAPPSRGFFMRIRSLALLFFPAGVPAVILIFCFSWIGSIRLSGRGSREHHLHGWFRPIAGLAQSCCPPYPNRRYCHGTPPSPTGASAPGYWPGSRLSSCYGPMPACSCPYRACQRFGFGSFHRRGSGASGRSSRRSSSALQHCHCRTGCSYWRNYSCSGFDSATNPGCF